MQQHTRAWSYQVLSVVLGILWTCSPFTPAVAQADTELDVQVYTLGLHLFHLGDYYQAMTEFKRFSLLFPGHARQSATELLIGLALQEEKQYDAAFTHWQHWRLPDDTTDTARVAAFKLGELRFVQGQYRQAILQWQDFLQRYPEGPLVGRTQYLLSLSWALDGQREQAQSLLAAFPARDPLASQALALQTELRSTPEPTFKSPQTAGILSGVLPGAGHLYAGKPWQALTALLLNGVFLAGAAYAFHDGLEVTGAILLFFESGWYLGGIYSAMEATRATNRQQQQDLAAHLKATYAPPPLTFHALQTPALGLRLRF